MASTSFNAVASPLQGQLVTEKRSKTNFALWKAQVLPILRGAHMYGFIDGTNVAPPAVINGKDGEKTVKVPNPEYVAWHATEQQVLGFLMTSLSREVMVQVASLETP